MEPPLPAMDCSYFTHACSVVSDSVTPWTVAHKLPLSMEFSRQEYLSGLLLLTSGNLPDPEMESESLAPPSLAGGFFTTSATWEEKSATGPQGSPMVCFLKQILNTYFPTSLLKFLTQ